MKQQSSSITDIFKFKDQQKTTTPQHQHDTTDVGSSCPACQSPVQKGADICEQCGKWLLEGQCCFCYAPVGYDQKFCGSCGNPPKGLQCKQCSTFSHFDFCPGCDAALSRKAGPSLESLKQSAEFLTIKSLLDTPGEPGVSSNDLMVRNSALCFRLSSEGPAFRERAASHPGQKSK